MTRRYSADRNSYRPRQQGEQQRGETYERYGHASAREDRDMSDYRQRVNQFNRRRGDNRNVSFAVENDTSQAQTESPGTVHLERTFACATVSANGSQPDFCPTDLAASQNTFLFSLDDDQSFNDDLRLTTELADDDFQHVEFQDDEVINISTSPLLTCGDIPSTDDEFVIIDGNNASLMPEDDDFVMLEPALPPLACPVSPIFEPTYCGLDSMAHNHFAPVEFLTDARSIEHDESYATITADGSVLQPSYIGTLPMILIDIAGKSILVLVTNVLSVRNWPKTRILLSIGQWEQSLDSENGVHSLKLTNFLYFS